MPIQVDLAGLSRQDFWMIFNWGGWDPLAPPQAEAQQTGALNMFTRRDFDIDFWILIPGLGSGAQSLEINEKSAKITEV